MPLPARSKPDRTERPVTRRRSSAQPRRLERLRSRWTQGRGRSDRATKKMIRAHPAMSRPPRAALAARLGWSTRGTARIAATSATVTWAITTSTSGRRAFVPAASAARPPPSPRPAGRHTRRYGRSPSARRRSSHRAVQRSRLRPPPAAGPRAPSQTPVAQRDVHADGQHQHREAALCQERHRRVVGVDDIEAAAAENDSGDDLADHDRDEPSPAGRNNGPSRPAVTINASSPRLTRRA